MMMIVRAFISKSKNYGQYDVAFEVVGDTPARWLSDWDGSFETHREAFDYANRMTSTLVAVDSEIHGCTQAEMDSLFK